VRDSLTLAVPDILWCMSDTVGTGGSSSGAGVDSLQSSLRDGKKEKRYNEDSNDISVKRKPLSLCYYCTWKQTAKSNRELSSLVGR
jgi:hypothetical protein